MCIIGHSVQSLLYISESILFAIISFGTNDIFHCFRGGLMTFMRRWDNFFFLKMVDAMELVGRIMCLHLQIFVKCFFLLLFYLRETSGNLKNDHMNIAEICCMKII